MPGGVCPGASAHLWGRLVPRPGAAAQMLLEIRVLGPLVKPLVNRGTLGPFCRTCQSLEMVVCVGNLMRLRRHFPGPVLSTFSTSEMGRGGKWR